MSGDENNEKQLTVDTITVTGKLKDNRSAAFISLDALIKGFDPEKHRHTAEERFWDDHPVGKEFPHGYRC